MGRQVSAHKRRLAEEDVETVREDYVKKMRDNYPLIIRTLMHDLILSIDKDGNLVFLNDAAVEFFGKPSEEIIGTHFSDYLYPEDIEKTNVTLQEMIKSKDHVKDFINRQKTPRGWRTVAWNAVAIFDEAGNYVGAQATGKDLTDLLRAEEELEQSKQHLNTLLEVMVDPIVIVDLNGSILEVSHSAEEILGFPKEELVGKHFLETKVAKADSEAVMIKNLERMKKGLYIPPYTVEAVANDGKKLFYEVNPARIVYKGEPATLAIFRNITEQKKAEEKLQASEERFRYFLDNAPEAIWVQDVNGVFIDGNKRAEELTGYKREEMIGKNMLEMNLVPPEDIPRLLEAFKPNKPGEISGPIELELMKKDGSLVSIEASTISVERDGKIEIIGITRDITDRKEVENALRQEREMLEIVTENISAGLTIISRDYRILWANNVLKDLLGDIEGKNCYSTIHHRTNICPDCKLEEIFEKGKSRVVQEKLVPSPGGQAWLEIISTAIRDEKGNITAASELSLDITERKKTELALRASEQKFRTIFEGSTDGILGIDPETQKVVFANPRMHEITGYPLDELLKLGLVDLFRKDDLPVVIDNFEKHLAGKVTLTKDQPFLRKDKKIVYCDSSSKLLNIGNQLYLVGFLRDVTEQRKAKDALRVSEKRFREMNELLPEPVFETDIKGFVTFVNRAAFDQFGYSQEDLEKGLNIFQMLAPESRENAKKRMVRILSGETLGAHEYTAIRKDGSKFPIIMHTTAIMHKNKAVGMRGVLVDITERKKMEVELDRVASDLTRLVDTANAPIFGIDRDGLVTEWNQTAVRITGYSKEETIGKNLVDDFITADYKASVKEVLDKAIQGEDTANFEFPLYTKDGQHVDVLLNATSRRDASGNIIGVVGVGQDITERKKMEVELMDLVQKIQHSNKLLEQSNQELENYTYAVSHDLKAPLRTIQSFGGFLLEDYGERLDETGQDYLQRMINASSNLNAMIEDLLSLSRVGRKFTKVKKTDLNKLLQEILSDLEVSIKERNAEVVVDKLPVISIQRMWIKQLFMNLIDNGLKFNKSKTPKVEVLHQERENDHLFKVRDNGIGIEEKYLERIFNLFEKLHTKKEYTGTGAGLAICKKIVEQFGGKIWVESKPGEGSTFMFTIPKKIKQTEEAKI